MGGGVKPDDAWLRYAHRLLSYAGRGPMSATSPTLPPDILALDFDGVLCDGMREYFETSRRAHNRVWPAGPRVGNEVFPAFDRLRPVIMTGWEMPLLLRAIGQAGRSRIFSGTGPACAMRRRAREATHGSS